MPSIVFALPSSLFVRVFSPNHSEEVPSFQWVDMPTSEEYGCTLAELRALMELRGGEALEKVVFPANYLVVSKAKCMRFSIHLLSENKDM